MMNSRGTDSGDAISVEHPGANSGGGFGGKCKESTRSSARAQDRRAGRSLTIDMLRGIAILMVLGRHYVVAPGNTGVLQPFAVTWTTIGWAGVDLFFVLSGFLVSGLIFAEYRQHGRVDIRRFVIRRGFKIWPPYLVYIVVVAAWLIWQSDAAIASIWTELWPNVFHVQNYFHTPRLHTWSLAVEEHFYLAVAFAFYWLLSRSTPESRRGKVTTNNQSTPTVLPGLPIFIVSCVVGLAALRHVVYLREGPANLNLYATHLRFDGLLIGTLLAYWTHFRPARLVSVQRHPLTAMLIGVLFAAPALALSPEASAWTAGVGLTGLYVGFALLMMGWLNVANIHPAWRRLFRTGPAALLGQVGFYSYSIYLWHVDLAQTPIKKLVEVAGLSDVSPAIVWPITTTIYVIIAVTFGGVLARWLEIPSLALRDRLFPSTSKPLISNSGAPPMLANGLVIPAGGRLTVPTQAGSVGLSTALYGESRRRSS
jgi:peptidoglycan/LPS O-acetylase OafA/YrhL